jgi:hypothetical protein
MHAMLLELVAQEADSGCRTALRVRDLSCETWEHRQQLAHGLAIYRNDYHPP